MKKKPLTIGLTGGIATGKSVVLHFLEQHNIEISSADEIGHFVLKKENIREKLVAQFGYEICKGNEIDRAKLGAIVFENKEKLNTLNNIVHPVIREEMIAFLDCSKKKIVVMEVPLLFENELAHLFDYTLVVACNNEIQLERLMKRNQFSEKEARSRIEKQLSTQYKVDQADFVVHNNQSIDDLLLQMNILVQMLPYLKKRRS